MKMPILRFKLPNFRKTAAQMPVSTSTHLETSTSSETSPESCLPFLPPELISLVLLKLWEAPQALQERWTLLKNIALVNRAWLALVARVSCQDVHISSSRQANAFLRLLPGRSPTQRDDDLFTTEGSRFANEMCRSITFYVDGSTGIPKPKESSGHTVIPSSRDKPATAVDAANAIRLVLDTLFTHNATHLPNLRHISLQYTDWDYDDVFAHLEQGTFPFPRQVTSLSAHYSFTGRCGCDVYMRTLDWLHARCLANRAGTGGVGTVRVPTLQHLSLSGVTTNVGLAILEVCPNIEALEIMSGLVRAWGLAPLPPSVRTLVLRYPSPALCDPKSGMLCCWKLHVALSQGLFPKGAIRPRIVVRSALPEPVDFATLRRICEHFDVELVYERDDAPSPSFGHHEILYLVL